MIPDIVFSVLARVHAPIDLTNASLTIESEGSYFIIDHRHWFIQGFPFEP